MRGKIEISNHAVNRFRHRTGSINGETHARDMLQLVYDKGTFVPIEGTDKHYYFEGLVVVVKNMAIVTVFTPPMKEGKVWLKRKWRNVWEK
jgi:hypothetical protein